MKQGKSFMPIMVMMMVTSFYYGISPTKMLPKSMSVPGSPTKLVVSHYQKMKCLV